MKHIGVCHEGGITAGMEKLSEELRKEGIPDSQVINVNIELSENGIILRAYIREDETLKIYEDMKVQIKRANFLLHSVSMTLSSGQAVTHKDTVASQINEYLA